VAWLFIVAVMACTTSTSPSPGGSAGATAMASVAVTSSEAETSCKDVRPHESDAFYAPTDVSFHDPVQPEWPLGTPADVGLDEQLLAAAADNAALSPVVQSLLVVRHGKLVVERYFNGSDAGEANNVASVSKSILSLVTGIAIEDGLLALDSRIDEFLPADLVGDHGNLTVEQLLTMSGGLQLSDPEYDYPPGDSFVRAVLARPTVAPAGSEFAYSTGLTQVLAAVLTEAVGMSLCDYASTRLLGPLGIDVERWWVEPGGYDAGGHSLFITPREMARIGQLVLNGGSWNGHQLVPKPWLDLTLAQRWDLGCKGVSPVHFGYGDLWWPLDVDGHLVWQASGYGSQQLWIVPAMGLLLVITHDAASVGDPRRQEVNDYALARAAILSAAPAEHPPMCPARTLTGNTMRADGTGRAPVRDWPANGLPWSWSADGSRIALGLSEPDLNGEIYTAKSDGTGLVRLTRDLAFDNLPAWSPDGTRIAFVRGGPAMSDLYLVRPDGSALTQLTDFDGFESAPTWSPDGRRIAFVWGHTEARGFGESAPLWVIAADGSDPTELLDRDVGYPSWAPDGRSIALEIRGDPVRIGILDAESGALAELRPGFAPRWSPDGKRIAFVGESHGSTDIFVMDPDGRNIVQLTDDDAFDTFPIWSPDGQTILFLSSGGSGS
jgi:CubicO group peptidase (beta-lactamase class C family)